MKTSLEIEEGLFRKAKELAARRRTTIRGLVERGLRHVIAEDEATQGKGAYQLEDESVGGNGLQPGIDPKNWRQILAISYGFPAESNDRD